MWSCGLNDIAKLVKVPVIDNIQFKGITGVQFTAHVENDSKYRLSLEDGEVIFYQDGKFIAKFVQVSRVVSEPHTHSEIDLLWKIEDVDPLSLILFAKDVGKNDYEGMTIDYSGRMGANMFRKTISDKGVVVTELIDIFAKN